MSAHFHEFVKLIRHPLKFRMFLLSKLPAAYVAGVRVRSISETRCAVSIPYKWYNRNPFRSTYFACLSMAAEMSTAALAMGHLYKRNPSVSMLVVKVEGEYFKKSTERTTFICDDGQLIEETIENTITSGEPKTVTARSTGRDRSGEVIAVFNITWSFKRRT